MGYLFHVGKNVDQDIEQALKYYKEASSFYNQHAKNNLGVLYKNGFGDKIKKKINLAIEYFQEAKNKNNDLLSVYHLAHIYFFEETIENDYDKSIKLLLNSLNTDFIPIKEMLCLILIKKFDFDFEKIKQRINDISHHSDELLEVIINQKLLNSSSFDNKYQYYRGVSFIYDNMYNIVPANTIMNEKVDKTSLYNPKIKNISGLFYDGLGFDIKAVKFQ